MCRGCRCINERLQQCEGRNVVNPKKWIVGLLAFWVPVSAMPAVEDLVVEGLTLIEQKRTSRFARHSYFLYQVNITNPGPALTNVTATVSSTDPSVRITERRLVFGDVAAEAAVSSNDTFAVRVPRGQELDPGVLVFQFSGELATVADTTAPSIQAEMQPPANANGWHNSDVIVSFICNDDGSGVASCPEPVIVSAEGAGQTVTGEAVDNAGNVASVTVTVNIDKTAPVVSLSLAPGSDTQPAGDAATLLQEIAVQGVTEPGLQVELFRGADLSAPLATGLAAADGTIAFGGIRLEPGGNTLRLRVRDQAGNSGEALLDLALEQCHGDIFPHAFLVDSSLAPAAGLAVDLFDPAAASFAGVYSQLGLAGGGRVEVIAAGLNGDALLDWVSLDSANDRILVFINNGTGFLPAPIVLASGANGVRSIAVADFVSSAAPDIAIAHADGTVTFLAGSGDGAFAPWPAATVGGLGTVNRLLAADFDGDGLADLVAGTPTQVSLLRNTGGHRLVEALTNGDFGNGLSGWQIEVVGHGADRLPGQVLAAGGVATLVENQSFRVSLAQTFRLGDTAQISFDITRLALDLPAGGLPDAFEVSLLDANQHSLVPTVDALATSFFNANPGMVQTAAGVQFDGSRVTLDVSTLAPGTEVTLYFDLIGHPPGTGSRVGIDNIDAGMAQVAAQGFAASSLPDAFTAAGGFDYCDAGAVPVLLVADPGQDRLFVYHGDGGDFTRTSSLPLGGL